VQIHGIAIAFIFLFLQRHFNIPDFFIANPEDGCYGNGLHPTC